MEVVCSILTIAATEDKDTALALLNVSKGIHNLILPILYDTVRLSSQFGAKRFALAPILHSHSIPGCSRPSVRYLNTIKGALGPLWRELAHGRPEIEHLCVSMMELHAMCSWEMHLQPSHIGILVDGIHLFPDYQHPPPDKPPRSTLLTYHRLLHAVAEDAGDAQPHATVFMRASHIYFVDNMPPNLGCLRPYLHCVTHFSFAYRRDYGLQFPELSAVLRAVLDIASITLVAVVRRSRTAWSEDEKEQLRGRVPESFDPRVVFLDDLNGLTWDEDEEGIWRMAEQKRLECQST
jgi:hypothetical protein